MFDPIRTVRRRLTRDLGLPMVCGLLAVASFGCKKPPPPEPEPIDPKAVMQQAGAGLTKEDKAQLRNIARERLQAKLDAAPAFDRKGEIRRLLKEKYKIDLDQAFPDGIDTMALKDQAQIEGEVRAIVNRRADISFPPEKRIQLEEEAKLQYPLMAVGDEIVITQINGRTVEGEITEIGPNHVKVKDRTVIFDDIKVPNKMVFDPETTAQRRERHIDINYDNDRRTFVQQNMAKLLPAALRENGFVRVEAGLVRIDQLIESLQPQVDEKERLYWIQMEEKLKDEVEVEMVEEGLVGGQITGLKPPPPPEESGNLLRELELSTGDKFTGYIGFYDGDTFVFFDETGKRREWSKDLLAPVTTQLVDSYQQGAFNGEDGLMNRVEIGDVSMKLPNGMVVTDYESSDSLTAITFSRPAGAELNYQFVVTTELKTDALEAVREKLGDQATPQTSAPELLTAWSTLVIANLANTEALDLQLAETQAHGDLVLGIQNATFGTTEVTHQGALIVAVGTDGYQCFQVWTTAGDPAAALAEAYASIATLQFGDAE